ncbi:MAG: hypothetical protein PHN18_10750 [Sulfurospirillaceae bacterium]|nr:hypothetical protein [Sulfurospirillaceae bacterium]MDD2827380.1 hypothetical protein [Sulfurospirillaceae bacterium]
MKTLQITLYCTILLIDVVFAKDTLSMGNEVKEYDTIFEKIAEKRIGIEASAIDTLANPFIVIYENANGIDGNVTHKPLFILEATLNQKAKINGNWYALRDKVDTFKLISIKPDSVILQNETDRKEIFIRTTDESNIKIFSK